MGFGLPGSSSQTSVVSNDEWAAFIGACTVQKIAGFALAAAAGGLLEMTEAQRDQVLEAHRLTMVHSIALEQRLVRFAKIAESADLPFVVLKGPALAHCTYPDPSLRGFSDIDILVRAEDWQKAQEILHDGGFQRRLPEPRGGFDVRFGKAAEHRDGSGFEFDVHRTLVLGPFGLWIEPEMLFERTASLKLGGASLRRLDDTMLLLHACVHAWLGWRPPLLMPLRDVAQIVSSGAVDWEELEAIAARWRLRAVVGSAFEAAYSTLGLEAPEEIGPFIRYRPGRKEWRALRAYESSVRWRGGTALGTVAAIRGPAQKLAYLAAMIAPDPEFMSARDPGAARGSYLRRWVVPLKWMTGGRR